MSSLFTNIKNRIKGLFTGNPVRKVSAVWKYGRDLPDYPTADSKDTYYRIWKDVAPIRAQTRARVNAATANGFVIKTYKKQDVEAANKRVREVDQDFRNPRNKIRSTIRSFVQNLCVYHTAVLETIPKREGGFIYPLDYRFCTFILSEDKRKVEKIEYRPSGYDTPIVYKEGQFVIATMDDFGSGTDGISQLEALRVEANLYKAVLTYNLNQFLGGGTPSLAFIMKNGTWDEFELMNENVKQFTNDSNIVLKGDVEIDKLSAAAKDMEYRNLLESVFESAMSVSQTPPIMMAKAGGSQGETNRQEMNAFAAEVNGLQAITEESFAEAIFNVYGYSDIYMKLNQWVDKRQQAAIDRSDMNAGIVTINEVRAKRDLPAVEWGDVPYVANYMPEITGQREWVIERPQEEAPTDPSQNEGNTGNEMPQGQDRDKVFMDGVTKWGLDFVDLVVRYQEKGECERLPDETVEECVQRKIQIILDENPDMDTDQAVAIAHALCEC